MLQRKKRHLVEILWLSILIEQAQVLLEANSRCPVRRFGRSYICWAAKCALISAMSALRMLTVFAKRAKVFCMRSIACTIVAGGEVALAAALAIAGVAEASSCKSSEPEA